jgi:ATP-dependent DNA helicase RecG
VCTLIDDSETLQCQAAEATSTLLRQRLSGIKVGLVHGRLARGEKEAVMRAFGAGKLDLLVATTVIEVGVDVPNATLMIIENAERLGLAQLHQLRGRVGRGSGESFCVLMYHGPLSAKGRARLEALRDSNDGFEIARRDLDIRGPGEVLGTRQTGMLQFRVADLACHCDLLEDVHEFAGLLRQQYPQYSEALASRWLGANRDYGVV